jgi:DNA-binding IclR family transcriptional regulator
MLLDMPKADIEALIGSQYDVYTPRTISTLDDLLAVLQSSRRHGHTTETEELALGRACIAAPIRDRTGQIVGALSIGGPLSAISVPGRQEELASRVLEATDRISTGLGYHGIPAPLPAPPSPAPPSPAPMTSVSAD